MLRPKVEPEHGEISRLETQFDALGALHAANEESGSGECDEGEGDLAYNEKLTKPVAAAALNTSPATAVQNAGKIRHCGAKHRRDSEEQAGENADGRSERAHAPV